MISNLEPKHTYLIDKYLKFFKSECVKDVEYVNNNKIIVSYGIISISSIYHFSAKIILNKTKETEELIIYAHTNCKDKFKTVKVYHTLSKFSVNKFIHIDVISYKYILLILLDSFINGRNK